MFFDLNLTVYERSGNYAFFSNAGSYKGLAAPVISQHILDGKILQLGLVLLYYILK